MTPSVYYPTIFPTRFTEEPEIKEEADKLSNIVHDLEVLETILDSIKSASNTNFGFDPHLRGPGEQAVPANLSIAPVFNISHDFKPLMTEVIQIRKRLAATPVDYSALIDWISRGE